MRSGVGEGEASGVGEGEGMLNKRVRLTAILEPDAYAGDEELIGLTGQFTGLVRIYKDALSGEFREDSGDTRCFHRVQVEVVENRAKGSPAIAAITGAKNIKRWGYNAAVRYALKRGCSSLMWEIVLRVETNRQARHG